MENTSIFIEELLNSDAYLSKIDQFASQPGRIKQANRLITGLIIACLHRQLQSDIGRSLMYRVMMNHTRFAEDALPFWLSVNIDPVMYAAEGNRLFSTIIPGKKSALVQITGHYAKLSFAEIDLLVGLCSNALFTNLSSSLAKNNDLTGLLPALNDLSALIPELTRKDYESMGLNRL
ncbi:hypothetical protein G8759_13420 [Spirosoma aureum]|uniref:Uncharacterized protein n=1 Tax=Spirosoma aureum TaxID=2692134 RepID=A0A6G9AM34_9BACT|nr:hypothetical protein [Spirosoma aureum]QIP13552.1 hypothetical protein G8759_13420 [Spirosoma aureum]